MITSKNTISPRIKNMEIELNELKHRVEELYGKLLLTSTDFDEFSVILKLTYNSEISTSTLKRLGG